MAEEILLLIDGNALVHRSFHGIPPLKTKDGLQVNAVYGFTNTILMAIKEFHPEYLVVTFDVGKKTFRNEKFADYKATRVKAPDELYAQFSLVKEVCNDLNIPQFGVKNFEADDVIGTICAKIDDLHMVDKKNELGDKKLKTIIITGDMDTLQLVTDKVNVYSVSRGIKKAETFDLNKVEEKYGFAAKYLVDYKGLRGDPSDNIPGVPGVGEITAKKIIKQFGTIENLYEQINQIEIDKKIISSKIKQLLLEHKEQAFLSKYLATIRVDVPLEFDLADAKINNYDREKAIKLFEKMEFKSLIAKLPEQMTETKQYSLF